MENGRKILFALSTSLVIFYAACSPMPEPKLTPTPDNLATMVRESNFSLIFKYGVTAKNELNTINGTYTKDMIVAPSITVKLILSPGELDRIYQKMQEINFFDYPDKFSIAIPTTATFRIHSPSDKYYFKVTNGIRITELSWDDYIDYEDIQASNLRELIQLIENIITSKAEYQTLPAPLGGYQ
jgi:hypothetical protein